MSAYERCPLTGGKKCRVLVEKLQGSRLMSAYERCPLTGGKKCRVLVEKLPGQQIDVRLREVSAYGR